MWPCFTFNPGKVFDLVLQLESVADGYKQWTNDGQSRRSFSRKNFTLGLEPPRKTCDVTGHRVGRALPVECATTTRFPPAVLARGPANQVQLHSIPAEKQEAG